MTAAQTVVVAGSPRRAPTRTVHPFGNLLRKELAESRGAFVVGLWGFCLMPAVLGLLYLLYDHELFVGFAIFPVIILGWFYAIVVGAHTVCRDWGRPEEHFLLAKPISPWQVVLSKLLVGLATVAVVMITAGLWDVGMAALSRDPTPAPGVDALLAVMTLSCVTGAFLLAFAVAFVIRQTLSSVLVTILILLIWVTGPLLTSRMTALHPRFVREDFDHQLQSGDLLGFISIELGYPFVIVVLLFLASCLAIAFVAAGQGRALPLGRRSLAWAIGLVIVGLFTAAMGEVGNSMTVRDTAPLEIGSITTHGNRVLVLDPNPTISYGTPPAIILPERQIQLITPPQLRSRQIVRPEMRLDSSARRTWNPRVAGFDVDPSGQMQSLQTLEIPIEGSDGLTHFNLLRSHYEAPDVLHLTALRSSPSDDSQPELWRLQVKWSVQGKPSVIFDEAVALPVDDLITKEPNTLNIRQHAFSGAYLFLFYAVPKSPEATELKGMLCVLDVSAGKQVKLIRRISVPGLVHLKVKDDRLELGCWFEVQKAFLYAALDVRPESLAGLPETLDRSYLESFKIPAPPYWELRHSTRRIWAFARQGWASTIDLQDYLLDENRGLVYLSDRLGLRVMEYDSNELIGEYRASPLAMVHRSDGSCRLVQVDDSLLLEIRNSGTLAFDISEPSRPRRIGFSALDHWIQAATATEQHLVLFGQDQIYVLDRPRARS